MMLGESKNTDLVEDEFLKEVLRQYSPESGDESANDIRSLGFLQQLKYDYSRCFSLNNEKVYKDWKEFLHNLPSSANETVPWPEERFWHWKMYKKYIPEGEKCHRKIMKAGPGVDKIGPLPITGEAMRFYRS